MVLSFSEQIDVRNKLASSKCSTCIHFKNFNNWSLECKHHRKSMSTSGVPDNTRKFYTMIMESKDFIFVQNCGHERNVGTPQHSTRIRLKNSDSDFMNSDRSSIRDNTFGDLSFGLFDGM